MTQPKPDLMNMRPVEAFVTDFAMLLAGSVTNSDAAEGLTPEQLGVVFFAAVGSFARTLPDYNPEQEIGDVIRLGVALYAESIYASVNAAINDAEANAAQSSEFDLIPTDPQDPQYVGA